MPFAKEKMGFSRPPRLFLRQDHENAADPLGKTGFYDVEKESITLYTTGRHPKDILRSLAHELQHHTQKCNGEFDNIKNMGEEGYAQNNPQLRTMEFKAYMASMCVRDFEDGLKLQKETIYYEHLQKGDNVSMSTKNWKNQELKSLLSEAWGFKTDLTKLNEKALEEYATGAPDPAPLVPEEKECDPASEDCPDNPLELEEMGCGDHGGAPGDMEMMVMGGGEDGAPGMEMEMPEEGGIQGLAAKAIEAIQALADAAEGQGGDMMDDDMMGERRGRGRKGPHIRGPEDNRLRPEGKELFEVHQQEWNAYDWCIHQGGRSEKCRNETGLDGGKHYDNRSSGAYSSRSSSRGSRGAKHMDSGATGDTRSSYYSPFEEGKDLSEAQVRTLIRKVLKELNKGK